MFALQIKNPSMKREKGNGNCILRLTMMTVKVSYGHKRKANKEVKRLNKEGKCSAAPGRGGWWVSHDNLVSFEDLIMYQYICHDK